MGNNNYNKKYLIHCNLYCKNNIHVSLTYNKKTKHIGVYSRLIHIKGSHYKHNLKEVTKIMRNLKINGCAICGYNKCISCLEFHHVNPENKKYDISLRTMFFKPEKIIKELNKCILLCANCHKEVHHENKE